MAGPSISVINFATDLDDREAQTAIRAVNRQIREDFAPIWGTNWELRLHASPADPNAPDSLKDEAVRGEGVLYLVDESTLPGALGYHSLNAAEVPFGFVFLLDGADWTVTLSHEALEMILDPTASILAPGPDPRDPSATSLVLHAYEACDAVERTSYRIDGVRVSNFVTPAWFFAGDAAGTRNDFLGVGVPSFGATPGSHLGFFDLSANGWVTYEGPSQGLDARLSRRADAYYFERKRPDEKRVNEILEDCRRKRPEALDARRGAGLDRVHGITRTDRHESIARRCQRA